MRSVRIAVLTNGYAPRPGGIERQLALILPILVERGHEALVITRRDPGTAPDELMDGVRVRRLAAPPTKALSALSFLGGALHRLRQFEPDIVHAHEFFSCATAGVMYRTFSPAPLVVTPHSRDLERLLAKPLGSVRLKLMCRAADAFTMMSDEHDAEMVGVGVPDAKRSRITNGVDTDHFRPPTCDEKAAARESLGLGTDVPVATYCGRIETIKGVERLLDAWTVVRTSHPEAELVVVGDGSRRNELESRVEPGCIFVGHAEDVRPYLAAADVYVQLSDVEGFSNSIIEAHAMGLPVVVTEVGGVRELVGRQRTGKIVEPSPEAAARAVVELFDSPAERDEMAVRARAVVDETMSGERIADQWERLFARLEGCRRSRDRS